jgi:hypothetical protein
MSRRAPTASASPSTTSGDSQGVPGPVLMRPVARYTLLSYSLIAGLSLWAYAPLFLPGFEFLSWDDTTNIVENPLVSNPDEVDLLRLWTSTPLGVYEPIGVSLKLLLVSAFGMHVQPFQLATLFFHMANACLLFLTTRRLVGPGHAGYGLDPTRANLAALVATLLFVLHPLRVETVAWASGQSYVVATFFLLIAVLGYLRHCDALRACPTWRPTGYFALSLLAFGCAVLSKSATIFLPALLLVIDFYPLRRRSWVKLVFEKAAFGVIGAGAAGVAIWATAGAQAGNSLDLDLTARIAYALQSLLFHLRLTLWPDRLVPIYPVTQAEVSPVSEILLIHTLGVAALCLLAWRCRQRAPWFTALWCAYVVGLLPVSGLVPHGASTLGADRYTYSTTFGFYILLGAWIASPALLPNLSLRDARTRVVAATIALGLCVLGVSTHRQLQYWRNTESLWRHTIRQDPANPMALNNLGYHYLEQGRPA